MPGKKERIRKMSAGEMRNLKNYLAHGMFYLLYAPFKYLALPLANYLRFGVLKLFSGRLKSTSISEMVTVMFPWRVRIGRRCSLNQGVIIDGTGGVDIGDGVRIAPNVIISTADHDFSDAKTWIADQGFVVGPVTIGDDVWIGAGVVINKGVSIGTGAVIGSGAVVVDDIPAGSIAMGVPCKVVKQRG